ncbi:MAG: aromatic ring-hydroxylating dioxygenase subunit alpha [Ilumatobacteraceae bacterium]
MIDLAPLDPAQLNATRQPFGHARMLPRAAYVDPAMLDWERRRLFDGGWVCAGRLDSILPPDSVESQARGPAGGSAPGTSNHGPANHGPANQAAVNVGGSGVLITRDAEGTLAAFANICRHRGHELLACGATTVRGVVQCPYHAWTYGLGGALRIAPHCGDVPNLVPDELGLLPVGLAQWGGWLFVNSDNNAGPFAGHLGGFAELVAPWSPERLVVAATHRYELRANWKVAIENYHECYHCPLIHPELCRVSPADSGVNIHDLPGAFVGGAMRLADHAATMSLDGRSPLAPFAGLDDQRRRQVLYLNLFPNLLVSLHPDYVLTHRIEPLTPTTSRIECQWLFDRDDVDAAGFDPAFAVDFWDVTNREDWAAVESVQRGLDSPRFVPGIFTAEEDAVYHFASMVAAAYAGVPLARASERH